MAVNSDIRLHGTLQTRNQEAVIKAIGACGRNEKKSDELTSWSEQDTRGEVISNHILKWVICILLRCKPGPETWISEEEEKVYQFREIARKQQREWYERWHWAWYKESRSKNMAMESQTLVPPTTPDHQDRRETTILWEVYWGCSCLGIRTRAQSWKEVLGRRGR